MDDGGNSACSTWFDSRTALLNSSSSAVSHSFRQTLGCLACSIQVAMFRIIDNRARKKGRLCAEWTSVEEQ